MKKVSFTTQMHQLIAPQKRFTVTNTLSYYEKSFFYDINAPTYCTTTSFTVTNTLSYYEKSFFYDTNALAYSTPKKFYSNKHNLIIQTISYNTNALAYCTTKIFYTNDHNLIMEKFLLQHKRTSLLHFRKFYGTG